MLARNWKRIGMLILIIACVFNIMNKLVNKVSLDNEMVYSATYMNELYEEEKLDENNVDSNSENKTEIIDGNNI